MGISLSIAHGNKECRIRPSVLCSEWELYNTHSENFFNLFFLVIWLVPKRTKVEISPILKDNANLLQLQGTITLVLVVVSS